ncbi:MAG: hypothetical protein PF440_04670, partial [Thiomicrorhabdus sp.]|nr:hypothetical protein [Thiomicrorhabdus sp.]
MNLFKKIICVVSLCCLAVTVNADIRLDESALSIGSGAIQVDPVGSTGKYYLWQLNDSLDERSGMPGSITRESAAYYVDPDGILQVADGDATPFSHASIEDETGYTDKRGSFVDGQAWFDGEVLGATLWDADAAVFTSGTYGWVRYIGNTIANVANELEVTYGGAAAGARNQLRDVTDLSEDMELGSTYELSIDAYYSGGAAGVQLEILRDAGVTAMDDDLTTIKSTYKVTFVCDTVSSTYIRFRRFGASNIVYLDNLSLKKLEASPADQAGTGNLLIIDDTAAKGYGYIGEVGTGETLDTTLVTNGEDWTGAIGATPPTDWVAANAPTFTIMVDAGVTGAGDDAIKLARNATLNPRMSIVSTTEVGKLYKFVGWHKNGDAAQGIIKVGKTANSDDYLNYSNLNTAVWTEYSDYFVAETTTTYITLIAITSTGAQYELFDAMSLKEVTEPSATAVKIYKEYELTNEGWNALDTGINYNAGAAWEFDVYTNLLSSTGSTAQARFEANGYLSEWFEATNWCLHSNDLNEWISSTVTEAQDETGPDGVANSAWTVTDPGGSTLNSMYINLAPANSTDGTYSVFVKEGTSSAFTLLLLETTTKGQIDFQWTAGILSVKSEDVGIGEVEQLGSTDWWRIKLYPTTLTVGNSVRVYLHASEREVDPGSAVTTIFFGAQFEPGTVASSYIPTTTIPVTRTIESNA